jgi:hypothetical protein
VLVAHVDLMKTPTKEKLAAKLAESIHEDIASAVMRARERLGIFRGLRVAPTVTVDPDTGAMRFGFETGRQAADLDATLERLLELPAQLAAARGRRVAIVFDEFQEVTELDPRLPGLMRAVFQEQPDVAHVYLGSKRDMLRRLFNDENEPFWRSAKQMELGVIPPERFRGFVAERFEATGRRIAPEAVEQVLAITGGHPYGTQELAYFLWQEAPVRGVATPAHVDAAVQRVVRSEHAHFGRIWEKAPRGQRVLLQALASGPGRPFSEDFRRAHGLPSMATVQTALDALVRDELVAREPDGRHAIAEPFLAEWIRGHAR